MSDFLSWDTDLDLELLLGEYTEYDPSDSDTLPTSLCNIANDPFVVNPHEIKDLCQQLENNSSAKEYLNQVIYTIFEQSNSTLTQIIDRENLFRKLHKVRSDVSLRQKFLDHFPTSSEKVLSIFWQLIFEDIIGEIMSQMTKVQKHNSEKEQSQLTGNDQSILFLLSS
ncbi:unnamed protein product [Mytilus edulis]|uniref:Uncharacterized protein n=1 Tax=Mytilus edulis TaxID=6550 RepID=A0A8S3V180_MYTED|nr:unnamed protein product [Mytilus edulis]